MAILKKKKKHKITSIGTDVDKIKSLCALMKNIKWGVLLCKIVWWFLKKFKHRIIMRSATSIPSIYAEMKVGTRKYICTPKFIAA